MKTIDSMKKHLPGALICLIEIAAGVILLLRPVGFTALIIIAAGILLALRGLADIIHYFHSTPSAAEKEQKLARGLIALLLGLFAALQSGWIVATFPVITALYGVAILIAGLYKIQFAADMLRQKKPGWQWAALSAGLAIIFAVIILLNPFSTTLFLWTFTAIGLIAEAIIDLILIIRHR
ncbi:MAG: hypothetical protein E7336_02075 [Clostridiales bacterium]|nr:hypothetical protein [Clostridiales bacterium]